MFSLISISALAFPDTYELRDKDDGNTLISSDDLTLSNE